MARRFQATVALLLTLLASMHAGADIGYSEAVGIACAARPGEPLFGIRKRTHRGVPVFAAKLVQPFATNYSSLKIDTVTGSILNEDTEPILPPADIEAIALLARYEELEVGFDEVLTAATQATGQSEDQIVRVDLAMEFLLLFYDIRFTDGTRVLVDGVTGIAYDNNETAQTGHTVTTQELSVIVDNARVAAGPGWVPFESEVFAHPTGLASSTLLVNPLNGRVKQVTAHAGLVEVVQFTPVGTLAEGVAALRPALPSVVVSPSQFLERLAAELSGATVANIKLASRLRNGSIQTRWGASVLLPSGDSAEYALDATVPASQGALLGQLAAPTIEGDFNGDGHVLVDDLVGLMSVFGEIDPVHDLDRDGAVGGGDLAILLRNWG